MKKENMKCASCRFKPEMVSTLNMEELCLLEKGCTIAEYKKGELIFKEGTIFPQLIYIRKGFVKLCKTGNSGKDLILNILKAGTFLGIHTLIKKLKMHYFSAYALTGTEVCLIDSGCLVNLIKQNGNFALEMISFVFEDEMNFFDRMVNNVQLQLPGRLAGALLFFQNQVYNSNPFPLDLTKAELASLVGASRESVSRLLKTFRDDGLVETYKNRIHIMDPEKLCELKQKG